MSEVALFFPVTRLDRVVPALVRMKDWITWDLRGSGANVTLYARSRDAAAMRTLRELVKAETGAVPVAT